MMYLDDKDSIRLPNMYININPLGAVHFPEFEMSISADRA